MREANAIDFWRGFALVTIFINHIPGNTFERYTFSQYGISDAAELFVFLAGWSIGIATRGRDGTPEPGGRSVVRLLARTVEVYRAQLTVMLLALALIAGAALVLDNPLILEWHNAGGFFADPIQSVCGMALLTYQLGFFNILPLYVVLIGIAPVFVLAGRISRVGALALSGGLYLASLVFEWNLPSWPGEGGWFFDPLCWQLLLVLGFVLEDWNRQTGTLRRWSRRLTPVGILVVVLGIVLAVKGIRPDPLVVPEPRLLFTFEKTYLTPARLVHFLGMLLAFAPVYALIAPRMGRIVDYLAGLGRNSLAVFSMGSILSLVGQLVRFQTGGGPLIDVLVAGAGLFGLGFTAWFVEWRTRKKAPRT
ncbi:OpgC domain-containing protein [Methylobacterium sp. NEAU 140]|uniref:OpgC family protein n=1 Tax=Methylobacterium sp. NEAU 140 TaxID=3064945 RepID=UPI0027326DA0|nr:OpgC domain-containing protein [Methylobacterium sp. NEAU 140]MDP4022823.1 OpgC domain-containing protein [Methylobacterium sp. NEAU 140]